MAIGGWKAIAQAFLRSAAEAGLSANEAISQMQQGGISTYRRTDMLADYRSFANIPAKADMLKYVRSDYTPSQRLFTEVSGYQHSLYRYQINFDLLKRSTGERFTFSTNVASDSALTKGEASANGINSIKDSMELSDIEITGYQLYGAFHKAGESWD